MIKEDYTMYDYQTFEEKRMHTVSFINQVIENGHASEMILVTEAIQEKELAKIAEEIAANPDIKIVLIAGPSSSGKTSTSKRLCIQLMACHKHPVALSTDNWFVNREDTPLDDDGKSDFETIKAMDLERFNQDLNDIICGRNVLLPNFNFITGKKEYNGHRLQLTPDMILVIEGIHALNPIMTESVNEACKYKIFAAPISPLSLDGEHWIPTSVNRLLRRISRDYKTRGKSALETISGWDSVRRGEEKWIIPYKDQADACFDTSMLYELAALKPLVDPVLHEVPTDSPEYDTVCKLLNFLSVFKSININQIPRNSLMREFVGGSFFDVG